MQTHHFSVRKSLLSNYFNLSNYQIAQLLLIRKFYFFRKGPHIYFKYAQRNHLHYPMMGEASLET